MNISRYIRKLWLLCGLLLLPCLCVGQRSKIDSLSQWLGSNATSKEAKLDILLQISYAYIYLKADSAIAYAKQANLLASNLGNKSQEATAWRQEGLAYFAKGNIVSALQTFKVALKIAEQSKDAKVFALCQASIGLVYMEMQDYPLSLQYYHKAYAICKNKGIEQSFAVILSNIGRIYTRLEQVDSAFFYLDRALPFTKTYRPDFQAFVLNNMAQMHLKINQLDSASANLKIALRLARQYNDKQDLSEALRLKATLSLKRNLLDSALWYAQQSLAVAQENKMKVYLYKTYQLYSEILEAKKDTSQAYLYHKLFVLYKDSVQSIIANNALQIFEYEKEQGEIALLTAERNKQDLERRWIVGSLILTMLVAVFLIYGRKKMTVINKNLREKQEEILAQNEEMRQYQDEIKNLNNSLEQAVFDKTKELTYRNQQLTEYAFFNAHKLRSPIATILGLYELLKLNPSHEEREFIITQIGIYIVRLDELVRKSQQLLDESDVWE
jgi:signal transduction histidine kinase